MIDIDLTGIEVKVFGNPGDTHIFRLSNPVDQAIIADGQKFEATFTSHLGEKSNVELDITGVASGVLKIPVTIKNGTLKVFRVDPRRTLITFELESR